MSPVEALQHDKPFTILIGPANTRDRTLSTAFEQYLRENLPAGVTIQEQGHLQRGVVANAADIHILLADASAIASIAGLIWALYTHFVEKRRKERNEGFVIAQVQYNRRAIWLKKVGEDIVSEAELQESLEVVYRIHASQPDSNDHKR